jgi:hypothetical protein
MRRPIILPFPDKRLSPNARINRFALASIKQDARETGFYAVKESGLIVPNTNLQAFIKINPPDNRWRDDDNILSSLKAARDGIFDALNVNDKLVRLSTHGMGKVIKGGRVTIWYEVLNELPEWMEE